MVASTDPAQLQRVAYAVHKDVMNRQKPIAIDRKEMPWLSFLSKRKKTSGQAGGSTIVKLKKNGGLDLQFFERRDPLAFGEPDIALETEWPFTNCHLGIEMVHDDLRELGYEVEPNGPRGKNFAKPMGDDEANRLVNYYEEVLEDMMDTYDIKLDQTFLRDGSYDAKAPVGLDGIINPTPTTGTIGGKSRSNPLLRHTVISGATTSAGGTLRQKLTLLRRTCNLNGRGRGGMVDFIMAGSDFIDGYIAFAVANGLEYQVRPDKSLNSLDIGIPEAGVQFEGLPIIWNPTFDLLDQIETASPTWSKRAYMLTSKTWQWVYREGLDKKFSAPLDPSNQRFSRLSLDGRYGLICTVPNANGLISIA